MVDPTAELERLKQKRRLQQLENRWSNESEEEQELIKVKPAFDMREEASDIVTAEDKPPLSEDKVTTHNFSKHKSPVRPRTPPKPVKLIQIRKHQVAILSTHSEDAALQTAPVPPPALAESPAADARDLDDVKRDFEKSIASLQLQIRNMA